MWDGQRAIKLIRAHASQLGIDPSRVALLGFSAGGHLASTLALHSVTDFDLPTHDAIDRLDGTTKGDHLERFLDRIPCHILCDLESGLPCIGKNEGASGEQQVIS